MSITDFRRFLTKNDNIFGTFCLYTPFFHNWKKAFPVQVHGQHQFVAGIKKNTTTPSACFWPLPIRNSFHTNDLINISDHPAQKKMGLNQRKLPSKSFKICYILCIRKPMQFFFFFRFVKHNYVGVFVFLFTYFPYYFWSVLLGHFNKQRNSSLNLKIFS